jgi:mannose-6-phosphate isomerase-like protein (cupin superfamily)
MSNHPDEGCGSGANLKAILADLRARIPGPVTEAWPGGEPFATALRHGSMTVELFAPVGADLQTPHTQDELYFIHSGTGILVMDGDRHPFSPGTCFFVPAGMVHRFEQFSTDFCTWVVFWGPHGGEAAD